MKYTQFLRERINLLETKGISVPFKQSQHAATTIRNKIKDLQDEGQTGKLETIHPHQLRATQPTINHGSKQKPIFNEHPDHPVGLKDEHGHVHISDGHHRSSEAYNKNKPIDVHIYHAKDLNEAYSRINPKKPVDPRQLEMPLAPIQPMQPMQQRPMQPMQRPMPVMQKPQKPKPVLQVHATDNEANSVTVSINGVRYEYHLKDGHRVGDMHHKIKKSAHKAPGKTIQWLIRNSKKFNMG